MDRVWNLCAYLVVLPLQLEAQTLVNDPNSKYSLGKLFIVLVYKITVLFMWCVETGSTDTPEEVAVISLPRAFRAHFMVFSAVIKLYHIFEKFYFSWVMCCGVNRIRVYVEQRVTCSPVHKSISFLRLKFAELWHSIFICSNASSFPDWIGSIDVLYLVYSNFCVNKKCRKFVNFCLRTLDIIIFFIRISSIKHQSYTKARKLDAFELKYM